MGIIYCAQNKVNGKRYIGQTVGTLANRRREHERVNSYCVALRRAIQKYGPANFEWSVLHDNVSDDQLDVLEIDSIAFYKTLKPGGYNLRDGGARGRASEETRARCVAAQNRPGVMEKKSAEQTARWKDPEYRNKQCAAFTAGHNKPELKAKKSLSQAARWQNPEFRENQIAVHTANWQDPEFRANQIAVQRQPEVKAKKTAAKIIHWQDPEYRNKQIAAQAAAWENPEAKARRSASISAALAKRTTEQKKESHRKAWETRRRKMALGQETT